MAEIKTSIIHLTLYQCISQFFGRCNPVFGVIHVFGDTFELSSDDCQNNVLWRQIGQTKWQKSRTYRMWQYWKSKLFMIFLDPIWNLLFICEFNCVKLTKYNILWNPKKLLQLPISCTFGFNKFAFINWSFILRRSQNWQFWQIQILCPS